MKAIDIMKLTQDDEEDSFHDLVNLKFETVRQEIEFLKRTVNIPVDTRDRLIDWWIFCFVARMGDSNGLTKEEFMKAVGDAYDTIVEENKHIESEDKNA